METFLQNNMLALIVSLVWVLPWKGYALWTASKRNDKIWFIVILIVNTFAILEIFYIFYIVKKNPKDLLRTIKSIFKSKKIN